MTDSTPINTQFLTRNETREWLVRCLKIVNAMAEEGMGIDGQEDPENIMMELCERLSLVDDDDPWRAVLEAVANG